MIRKSKTMRCSDWWLCLLVGHVFFFLSSHVVTELRRFASSVEKFGEVNKRGARRQNSQKLVLFRQIFGTELGTECPH